MMTVTCLAVKRWEDPAAIRVNLFAHPREALAAALALQLAADGPEAPLSRLVTAIATGGEDEAARRSRQMALLAHPGQVLLDERTVRAAGPDAFADGPPVSLGLHRFPDLMGADTLFQFSDRRLPAAFPPLHSLSAIPNNLPPQLTCFIGRESERAELSQLLAGERLVTLTGTGGAGKSRLALHTAAGLAERYPDGIWLIELAPLADGGLAAETVAATLGLRQASLAELAAHIGSGEILLLLDNCEHLREAAATLTAALLRACPRLRVLATSRAPLGLPGEQVWVVPCLSVPESVHLFVNRARSAAGGFALSDANARPVAQICRQLDGLPLAIELAAARLRLLSPEQLSARLDERLRLLQSDIRQATRHHQTMRMAIDWSHELLSPAEQVLWRRLSIFSGGFTLDAAEAVCGWGELERGQVLELLGNLIQQSLVAVDDGGEQRYRLLETLRQHAAEKLDAAGEAAAAGQCHRTWFRRMAEEVAPLLSGPSEAAALDWLEREHDNLRAALRCARDAGEPEEVGRIAVALDRFWQARGHMVEAGVWFAAALGAPALDQGLRVRLLMAAGSMAAHRGEIAEGHRLMTEAHALSAALDDRAGVAAALNQLGWIADIQGDHQRALGAHQQSHAIWTELGDERGIALSLACLGDVARKQGDYVRAVDLYQRSLSIRRRLGDVRGTAVALNVLGLAAYEQGAYPAAQRLYAQSLELWRNLKHARGMALLLSNLGCVAKDQGDYEAAGAHFGESLALNRELQDKRGTALSLINLGLLALCQGESERSRELLRESLSAWYQMMDRGFIACCLEGLAAVSAVDGDGLRAARLFGAARGLREAIGVPLPPGDRAEYERHVARAQQGASPGAFAGAWAEGQRLPLEQAVSEALGTAVAAMSLAGAGAGAVPASAVVPASASAAVAAPVAAPRVGSPVPAPGPRLTEREVAILQMAARGLTAREIGEQLHLSHRTVEKYEEALRGKLDVPNRAALAAWAARHGFVDTSE